MYVIHLPVCFYNAPDYVGCVHPPRSYHARQANFRSSCVTHGKHTTWYVRTAAYFGSANLPVKFFIRLVVYCRELYIVGCNICVMLCCLCDNIPKYYFRAYQASTFLLNFCVPLCKVQDYYTQPAVSRPLSSMCIACT